MRPLRPKVARPEKELKGFAKLALQPGESKSVTIELGPRSFAYYDPEAKGWRVAKRPLRAAGRLQLARHPAARRGRGGEGEAPALIPGRPQDVRYGATHCTWPQRSPCSGSTFASGEAQASYSPSPLPNTWNWLSG